MAAFGVVQWSLLDWEIPDLIVGLPDAKQIALQWAEFIEKPFAPVRFKSDLFEERKTVLVIGKEGEGIKKEELLSLREALPKKVYLWTLFS